MIELETKLAKNKLLKFTLSILLKIRNEPSLILVNLKNDFTLEIYDEITLNSISSILVG